MAKPCPLPDDALLARYADPAGGAYTDCFAADVAQAVSLPVLIEAFYSSRAFWLERFVVGLLFNRRADDAGARRLGRGEATVFSAWRVEERADDQVLMFEAISGKTRLWLRVVPSGTGTRLLFGSAVLPVGRRADGTWRMSGLYSLIGFHKIYARVLLDSAASKAVRLNDR